MDHAHKRWGTAFFVSAPKMGVLDCLKLHSSGKKWSWRKMQIRPEARSWGSISLVDFFAFLASRAGMSAPFIRKTQGLLLRKSRLTHLACRTALQYITARLVDGENLTMPCKNCGTDETIRAHLIPQAFVREVRGKDKAHAIVSADLTAFKPSQNGDFDDSILCALCDNLLGKDEKYAFETLAELRKKHAHLVNQPFEVHEFNGDRLLRFAMGIVWKFSVTRPHYGQILIGSYANLLRKLLFASGPIPTSINAFLIKLHSGNEDTHFYRKPIVQRYEGINFARFSVGDFIFMLKLDQRKAKFPPDQFWISGSSQFMIVAMPFNQFDEGKMVLRRKQNSRLDNFLKRVTPSAKSM
jgi:hypothetical protein